MDLDLLGFFLFKPNFICYRSGHSPLEAIYINRSRFDITRSKNSFPNPSSVPESRGQIILMKNEFTLDGEGNATAWELYINTVANTKQQSNRQDKN